MRLDFCSIRIEFLTRERHSFFLRILMRRRRSEFVARSVEVRDNFDL